MDGRLTRLLAATVAALALGAAGFTAGAAGTGGDSVGERQGMHDESPDRHAHSGTGHDRRDIDQMHAEMMQPLSPEERQLHDRMHRSCTGDTNDRSDT